MVDIKGEFLGFGVVTAITYAQYLPVQVAVLLVFGGRGIDGALAAYLYVFAAVEWCVDGVLWFFSPGASSRLGGAHHDIRLVTGGVVFEDGVVLIIEGVSAAAANVGAVEHPGSKEVEVRLAVIRIVGAEETNL